MGTGYKGQSLKYRSVDENVSNVMRYYEYQGGYFGMNSRHGRVSTRNIVTLEPLSTALDFYNRLTYGGIEHVINANMSITRMADGTIVTMRKVSHSDGSPAVDINVEKVYHPSRIKRQKIHFVKANE